MKKEKKHGKSRKKFFVALALGMLVVSGLAINVAAIDDNNLLSNTSYGVFKEIKNNPLDFINSEKLVLPQNFDYIKQMNKEFVPDFVGEKVSYSPGDSLKALQKEMDEAE